MWCVVADNGDEFWVIGLYSSESNAEEAAAKLQAENPEIEYNKAEFLRVEGK